MGFPERSFCGILIGLIVAWFPVSSLSSDPEPGITLSFPDTCAAPGDTIWLPIHTTDLTDSCVTGYLVKVVYDSSFVSILDVSLTGTVSGVWQFHAWNVVEGEDTLRIAAAGVDSLAGSGDLLRVEIEVLESAPVDSTSAVAIPYALFNEGVPAVEARNGSLTAPCALPEEVITPKP